MKNNKHIESLLDLFMQGETTLEQERELSQYFASSQSIPKEWDPYKDMFSYFDNGMPLKKSDSHKAKTTRILWSITSVAATVAIILAVVKYVNNSHSIVNPIIKPQVTIREETEEQADTASIVPTKKSLLSPILAQDESKVEVKYKTVDKTKSLVKTVNKASAADSLEIEREMGQVEQAQQELMADKFIIEQERQEVLDEQYASRAQAYQTQQAIYSEIPQFIQVVFK
jgi:hypothetical protein